MKIKKMYLGFENCELIEINDDDIKLLNISVNGKTFYKCYDGSFNKYYTLSNLYLELNAIADKKYCPFDKGDETTTFERIKQYMDISEIYIDYDNNEENTFYFCINFKDGNKDINDNQIVKENKDGSLVITIDGDKNGDN